MEKRKKIAIVTGASSGMGKEFVRQIRKKYQKLDEIWVIARNLPEKEEREDTAKTKIVRLVLDLQSEEAFLFLKRKLLSEDCRVKLLVNAAGMGQIGKFQEIPLEKQKETTRLNGEALMAVTYLCIPYMGKGSHIIQIASASAFLPQSGFAVYAASKAYVLSFSRALREELKKYGISVTCVCPGPVNTAFFQGAEAYHKMPTYKKKTMAEPSKVVEKAIRDAAHRRTFSIYGFQIKALFLAAKLLPHSLFLWITGRLYEWR